MAELLLSHPTTNVNAVGNFGYTPLHIACMTGRSDLAEHLIHKGANVNKLIESGRGPLHIAISDGKNKKPFRLSLIRSLLEAGAYMELNEDNVKYTAFVLKSCISRPSGISGPFGIHGLPGTNNSSGGPTDYTSNISLRIAILSLIFQHNAAYGNQDGISRLIKRLWIMCKDTSWDRIHYDKRISHTFLVAGYNQFQIKRDTGQITSFIKDYTLRAANLTDTPKHSVINCNEPESLAILTRFAIREAMGIIHSSNLQQLPLPTRLREYLMLPELSQYNEDVI